MDKTKIEKRIEEVKTKNDQINKQLSELSKMREQLIQEALVNNGRILELQEFLKIKDE